MAKARPQKSNLVELVDIRAVDPADACQSEEAAEAVRRALGVLTPRQRQLIELRFGFQDGVERTQIECADSFRVCAGRIRVLEKSAFARLRKQGGLEKYREDGGKIRVHKGMRRGELVQVFDKPFDYIGDGKIESFERFFFSFPDLYPVVVMEDGRRLHDPRYRVIPMRKAVKAANRLWRDLFGK